jgi:hypothetical protein
MRGLAPITPAWCMLALAIAMPSNSMGADAKEPIRIEYDAERRADCPSASNFEAQVFDRTRSARAAGEGESARKFIIRLRREGPRVTGSLVIQEMDGATMARRVSGLECADVATVLALATALAIDPRAQLAPGETLEADVEHESAADADELSEADTGEPSAEPLVTPAPPDAVAGVWSPNWSLGASASFAAAPKPAIGPSGMISLQSGNAPVVGEIALEFAFRYASSAFVESARAAFWFYAVRPMLCTSGVRVGASFQTAPCAVLEAGAVTGVGSEIANASRQTRFWATGEVLLRFELALGSVWFCNLDAGVASPLTRYQFVFQNPDTRIHEVPVLIATTALRVGTGF